MSRDTKAGHEFPGLDKRTPLVSEGPFPGTVNPGLAWTMPSNSGREAVTFILRGVGSASLLTMEVAIDTDFFALGRKTTVPIVPDLRLRLCQAVVDANGLLALLADLRRWETDRTPFRRQLSADRPTQLLTVELGERDGVTDTPEQPAFVIRYETTPVYITTLTRIEHGFVVDQSCVAIAIESLARIVEGVR